jgi:hypothetical protein
MQSMALARQQAAMTAAIARYNKVTQKAETDAKRLAVGDERLAHGDMRVACMIYARLAATHPPTEATEAAKKKVAELQEEAKQKLEKLDSQLAAAHSEPRAERRDNTSQGDLGSSVAGGAGENEPREESAGDGGLGQTAERPTAGMGGRIVALFREYDRLADTYRALPGVGSQFRAHTAKLRGRPENAAALNEPAASALWEKGQKHERENQLCCAYWAYKEAAALAPAPSAVQAGFRFAELAEDPQVVAAAQACRELKWCHQAYVRAERLLNGKPEVASEIFAEIVRRAPEDSEVYRAAQEHLQ